MSSGPIKLRIHHFICVHGFKGKGYSPKFINNFWRVIEELKNEEACVEVVQGTDSICDPCPNNNANICSEEDAKIRKLDDAYKTTLSIQPGQTMKWKDAKKLVAEKVSDQDFDKNCAPCSWQKFGVCKSALKALRKNHSIVLIVLSLVGFLNFASAQELKSIEIFEQNLLLDKSRRIPSLYKATTALAKGDFKSATDALKSIQNNPEFLDYFHYLTGQVEMTKMRKEIRALHLATAFSIGEKAAFHLSQVPTANPYTGLEKRAMATLGEVEVAMGDILYKQKKNSKALALYEKGFQRLFQAKLLVVVPKSSIFSYGSMCEKKPTDMCVSWVSKLAPLVAKTDQARFLEKILAFKKPYLERNNTAPYRVDLDLQAFQKGYTAYLENKYSDAFETWRDLLKSYPKTSIKLRTKFWMGRAAQKSKFDLQAETIYREILKEAPFSYYALLSSWASGIDLMRAIDAELPLASSEVSSLSPGDVIHIKKAEVLIASGVPELALLELQEVRPSANMPNEFLVYLSALQDLSGNHLAAFQIFSELASRNYFGLYSSYGQKLFFPTTRLPLIRESAKDFKVDPLLVLSIVKQESAFNPEAASGANAYGLMQIIVPTARDLDSGVEVSDLLLPAKNIRLGTKYIAQLLNRYRGNVISALAAYNAGPGNSDRWMREARPGLTPDEFIELISFRETREYVQNIIRNYYWYSRRIKGEHIPNLSALVNFNLAPATAKLGSKHHSFRQRTPAKLKVSHHQGAREE